MATTSNFAPGQSWTGTNPLLGTSATERARSFVRARRHTRFVRALRWSLPTAAASVVGLYGLMILETTGWSVGVPRLQIPRIIPDNLTMDNPHYEGFNKDGGKYVVTAKTAVQDLVNTERVRLNGINGDLTDAKKQKTNLKAAQGDFNTKTNELELSGGIDIVAESGMKAKLSRATILTKDNIIFSKEPVEVEMSTGTIRSNEMRLLNKTREVAFVGDVNAHLVPNKADTAPSDARAKPAAPLIGAGDGPIDITANRLDIDDTGKTATFTGRVQAEQGDAALSTSALEVYYEGGNNDAADLPGAGAKIKRITSKSPVVMTRAPHDRVTGNSLDYDAVEQVAIVDGNVQMSSGADRRATADKATVDQRADTILLDGDVVVQQGRNQLKGDRLFVERATGRTLLSSNAPRANDPGRIFARFFRGSESGPSSVKEIAQRLAAEAAGAAKGGIGVFKTDPTAPIDVEAARLEVDDHSKKAVFKGDVHAHQGDFVVRTSELRAFYTGSAGLTEQEPVPAQKSAAEITRIEARGKVIVTSKNGQNATGDWADFDVKNNQVVLGGDVVLTEAKNVVRGTRLTIDMVTGEAKLKDDGKTPVSKSPRDDARGPKVATQPGTNRRPSAIFFPRERKADDKKSTESAGGNTTYEGGWTATAPPQ